MFHFTSCLRAGLTVFSVSPWWIPALAFGSALNPDISGIGNVIAEGSDRARLERPVGMSLEEAEVALQSVVDPYFRADLFLSFHGEAPPEVEEAYASTLALPLNMKLRAGKMHVTFGKFNLSHSHTWLTTTPPLLADAFFGSDAWVDTGAELSWLAPLPTFHEISVSALRGNNSAAFSGGASRHWTGLAHLRNYFDVREDTSLEIGASAANGPSDSFLSATRIFGADLIVRWKPLEANVRHSVTFQSEAADLYDSYTGTRRRGVWALLDMQPAQRWHFAVRWDFVGPASGGVEANYALTEVVSFSPTEFSNTKLEIKQLRDPVNHWSEARLQFQFAIGAHGAHPY